MTDDIVEPVEPAPKDMEAARAARRAKRRFTADNAPDHLISSGVPIEFWPSRAQYTRWWPYLVEGMGADDEGWWYAKCPLHDPGMDGEMCAMISFRHGMLRCLLEEEDDHPCHPGKRGMTLSNLVGAMLNRMNGADVDAAAESV